MMTTLPRRLRRAVRRLGIDVVRHRPAGHDLVRLLHRYEIDLVLDVGAHRGDFGALLREAGYRGRIVSFEPLRGPRRAASPRRARRRLERAAVRAR